MVQPAVPAFLLIAIVLAGCVGTPETDPEPVDHRPRLDTFAGCPWQYPDDSPVDCDAEAPRLVAEPLPNLWVCVARNEQEGWSLHWDILSGTHGIRYWTDAELPAGAEGAIWLRTGGAEHLFVWEDAPQDGFLAFPVEFGETTSFRFAIHAVGYATNGTLAGHTGRPVWSLYDSQVWALHRFDGAGGTYSFQNMTETSFRVESDRGDEDERRISYEPKPFAVAGTDFTLIVHHERVHVATSRGAVETLPIPMIVDRACQLDLG